MSRRLPEHEIQPGETVAYLAEFHGLYAGTIWDHPRNAALRATRSRIDALAPGDVLYIPDREEETVELGTDRRHRFRRRGVPAKIRVQFREEGRPRAHQPYVLTVAGLTLRGTSDADGVVEAFVPASAREASLRLGDEAAPAIRLRLGRMEPDNTVAGLRKRLANLGIAAPEGDDVGSDDWRLALYRFQRRLGLAPSAELDPNTRAALVEDHDRVGAGREHEA